MDIPEQRERSKQSGLKALLKGWHDLSSPLGARILSIIIICGIVSMLVDYIGKRIGISQSIMNVVIIIIIGIAIVILSGKVSSATRESIKRRKEAYEKKYGSNKRNGR